MAHLRGCLPARIRHALAELPETLDETYERTLREVKNLNWEFAHLLLQCVAVAIRPLRVEELAEFLAFDFNAGPIPRFQEGWRVEDPIEAVLSTCSSLLVVVDVEDEYGHRRSKVMQFSHYSVKEYLTSARLAEASDIIPRRYHIFMTPAHTIAAQACLGLLLHLDENVTKKSLEKFPLAEYAAEHWFHHAQFEGVLQNVEDGLKLLFDPDKPHLAIWVWIRDPGISPQPLMNDQHQLLLRGTPLHYSALCGFKAIVEFLVKVPSQEVNARDFDEGLTPLHLASREGHVEVSRFLVEQGAVVTAEDNDGSTSLHLASKNGHVNVARFLIECGGDVTAWDYQGWTPLHLASKMGRVKVTRLLVERDADIAARDNNGSTPLHDALQEGHLDIARCLVEHGKDAILTAQDDDGWSPLHVTIIERNLEMTRSLVEFGADATQENNRGLTPLHLAAYKENVELIRFILEQGADVTARDEGRRTPLHLALGLSCA